MARIHRSSDHLGKEVEQIQFRYFAGVVLEVIVIGLMLAVYVLFWRELWDLGGMLQTGMDEWVIYPLIDRNTAPDILGRIMQEVARVLLKVLGLIGRVLPMLLPMGVAAHCSLKWDNLKAEKRSNHYRNLKSGVDGERLALELASELSRSCHVFVNKYILWDDDWSETDLIIVGPGGVVVVEVKNWIGKVRGDVHDVHVERDNGNGHYNPARQVGTHVYRLKEHLKSRHIHDVWVVPCVLFVNENVSVQMTGAVRYLAADKRDMAVKKGSAQMTDTAYVMPADNRGMVAKTVPVPMTGAEPAFSTPTRGTMVITAREFRENLAKPMEEGMVLSKKEIRRIVRAIRAIPDKE